MQVFRLLLLAGALFLPILPLCAAEMTFIEMWEEGDRYHLRSESLIEAPPELVLSTLLDYENFYRISGGIKETRYVEPDTDGVPRAYTRVESCVLFFCRSIEKVERVIVVSSQEIVLDVDPEKSDFRYNHSRWLIKPNGKGTRLGYVMVMEPDFWIPPLIGPWAIKKKLASAAMNMAHRLEHMARTGKKLSDFNIQ
jgi:Polyketide cyclase / dehydrase and lipid transport